MADPVSPADQPAAQQNAAPKPSTAPKPQNPVFRMMGMPNFRFRLPSRNWLIFLSVTGSFTAAVIYDRREKRRAQEKWSNLVAHVANESLPVNETRRKLTIFLSAPPGDGLRSAREYFKEYVKPILVSGAMDYEVLEGRKEGDIRAALAEKIRNRRREAGEGGNATVDTDTEIFLRQIRQNFGIREEQIVKGDMVIGRHAWREYVRGVHEGWLGPLDRPEPTLDTTTPLDPSEAAHSTPSGSQDDGSPVAQEQTEGKKEPEPTPDKKPEKSKPTGPTPAYVFPSSYSSSPLPATIPHEFNPSAPIAFPHILGFLNTPIRIYRFLNQRYLADRIGREVAAVVLANSITPYAEHIHTTLDPSTSDDTSPTAGQQQQETCEQQIVLKDEEKDWHKSVRKPSTDPGTKEREWLDDIVIDPRIGSRMRHFALSSEDEARAQRIGEGQEWVLGEERPPPYPTWRRLWDTYGWGIKDDPMRNVIIGNLDSED